MKKIDLIKVGNNVKMGQQCPDIEPNITEDCMFYEDGVLVGFYIKKMPKKMIDLADLANKELRSKNVPKTKMLRKHNDGWDDEKQQWRYKNQVAQYSAILGSIPPKAHLRRNYLTRSSIHQIPSAKTFVQAMLLLAKESEELIKEIFPEQFEKQMKLFEKVPKEWRFGRLFTSSISNYNISAPFHRDAGNIVGAVNVIITKKMNATGGNLHVPDYNATMDSANNSILVYPAWKNIHGVTPIHATKEGGYRNSLVFYPLKAFVVK